MKTIKSYLLLILFFNAFSQDIPISDSINLDSTNTDLTTTKSDNTLSNTDITTIKSDNPVTDMQNTDSSQANSDTALSKTDSSQVNSDITLPNTDSKPANSDITLPNTDSKPSNSDITLPNTDSKPSNSDITLPNTDSKPANNSDTTLPTIEPSNGNTTETTIPIIPIKPRIILLGFSLFQRPIRSLVTFKVYFKRFLASILSRFLYFTVNINYLRRLRFLEEQKANCTLITSDDDNMIYNCSVPVDENKDFTMSVNDDFEFVGLNPDLIISSYANNTMKTLSNQKGDIFEKGVLILTNSTLTQEDMTFTIEGYLMEGELKDKQVTLSFDENGNGNLVNATCNVNDKGNKKYELVCTSNKKIKAHLEGVMGKTSDKPLLIHMADANEDLVDLQSPAIRYKAKKSSSGISGGAIAGIIIGCCAALFAGLIIAYLCRRQTKPPIQQTSSLELNSSNQIQNNI